MPFAVFSPDGGLIEKKSNELLKELYLELALLMKRDSVLQPAENKHSH